MLFFTHTGNRQIECACCGRPAKVGNEVVKCGREYFHHTCWENESGEGEGPEYDPPTEPYPHQSDVRCNCEDYPCCGH